MTYHLEKIINIDSIKDLSCKEQYEFAKALINSQNSSCLALPNWEYDITSLIIEANQMLTTQSPVDFSFVTMFNSNGYEIGKFSFTEDSYAIAISEIHYNGLWNNLKNELTKKMDQCTFDVKFITNNAESFIIKGEDIGLRLDWPWMYPKDYEIVNSNVLIEVIIKKGKHKNMDLAIEYWMGIISSFA